MATRFTKRTKEIYNEYPSQFWLVMGATFIDRIGGALVFPFFALYLTEKFDVGITQVGFVFMLVIMTGMVGSMIGGTLTDRFGRKKMILFGLIASATSSLLLVAVNSFEQVYLVGLFVGFFSSIGGPAQDAIIPDILPEEQLQEGYGIWRVTANLAVTFGPLIGGFMAGYSYALLFIIDALTSVITAVILNRYLKESLPSLQTANTAASATEASTDEKPIVEGEKKSYGYMAILRDFPFLAFIGVHLLMVLVYMQMNNTLPVYLRDEHGIAPIGYGQILSMNAAMVVLLQFWITRKMRGSRPFIMMALGTAFYAVGFGMYGITSSFALFFVAMAIITIGEMIVTPIGQALVAKFSPPDMRGRYMAIFGFSWAIPSAFGLVLAGLVTDNIGANWVWYLASMVCLVVIGGYLWLNTIPSVANETIEELLQDAEEESSEFPNHIEVVPA